MPRQKPLPNIVFIVLDTHRYDRLGCYGYDKETSPNIDAFASRATVFEKAVSPAQWTIPAHASMFSGEYPTTHMTVQSSDALPPQLRTLAEFLGQRGYHTTGFCNNPLVGVLNNGLKRGFEKFYVYGGAIPTVPNRETRGIRALFKSIWEQYTQMLRKISYPIQNLVAQSDRVLQFTLHPRIVPLWTRYAHFKGHTRNSLRDATHFVRQNLLEAGEQPHFLFINLMETHLPYTPEDRFVKTFAPIVKEDPAARDFLNFYNTQAMRWLLPLHEPFPELEYQTLSSMYDAEVAYQDHLLAELLETLEQPAIRDNTLVIIVADHGEMLGEHLIMGHGLRSYEELIHVPLMIRSPGQESGERIPTPVSTTQLFHTVMAAAGFETLETGLSPEIDLASLSLTAVPRSGRPPAAHVISEAFPPQNVISIMRKHEPELLRTMHIEATSRAVYNGKYKLIQIEGVGEEMFDLANDPLEHQNLAAGAAPQREKLLGELEAFLERALARRPDNWHSGKNNITDEKILQQLRGLGYIE